MTVPKVQAWIAGVLLITAFVFLANDGRHHWHEFRYLYSATFYTTTELMQGVFDPGPAPVRTPGEVATWYVTELLHVYILKQLVSFFGVGLKSYTIFKTVYAMMLVAAGGLVWKTLRDLGMSSVRSVLTAGVFLVSPLSIYLGFKLMGEVPSLFFSACALAFFTAGMRRTDFSSEAVLSSVAGLFLALAMLASAKMPLLFLGFWAALLLVWVPAEMKKPILRAGIVAWTVFLIGAFIIFRLLGGRVDIYYHAMVAFSGFSKALPMWMFGIFNLGLFGMALWLFLPLAWLSPDQRYRRFVLVWLAFSGLPILLTTTNFLEPRYLATVLIPFVGLAALGLEALWDYLRALNWCRSLRAMVVTLLAIIVIGGAAIAQPFMPYESDTTGLVKAVHSHAPDRESVVILIPWNYSDFHFLRFAYPDRPIYLVQSAANVKGEAVDDPIWTERFTTMYGERYLPSAKHIPPEFSNHKLLYIGWTILPSLKNLHDLLTYFGFARLAVYLDSSRFRNHMTESWLIQDTRFAMRELSQYGQYQVYEVRYRKPVVETIPTVPLGERVSEEVRLWGMFETVIHNSRKYANAFVDTELEATFVSSSGRKVNVFGFYDGDGNGGQSGDVWKLRFMCMEAGSWRWSATFSDEAPGGSGSFHCAKSSVPGPLRVDTKNPLWLKTASGSHFLPRWYYVHELLFTKEGVWQEDVENHLVKNGYNMVTVLAAQAEHLILNDWNRREYERPLFYPWLKNKNGTVLWNAMDLNAWRKVDRVLQYLSDRNVYVYFFDGLFPNIAPRFPDNPVQERAYVRYVLARIGAYWNVTHNIAFEFGEFMPAARLKRIGRYVKEIDPFNVLLTVHDTQDVPNLVQSEAWLNFANLQYREGTAGSAAISNPFVVSHFNGKPVAATEMVWEGRGKLNAEQVRRGAWGILMAGGFFLYGEFNLHGTRVGNFGSGLAHPFLKIMFDFMETVPYWTMRPSNHLVDPGNFCLSNPGQEYVVYAEHGGPVSLDLSGARGQLYIAWLNPRTGESIAAEKVDGGTRRNFNNPAGDRNDWVLHLRRVS